MKMQNVEKVKFSYNGEKLLYFHSSCANFFLRSVSNLEYVTCAFGGLDHF